MYANIGILYNAHTLLTFGRTGVCVQVASAAAAAGVAALALALGPRAVVLRWPPACLGDRHGSAGSSEFLCELYF